MKISIINGSEVSRLSVAIQNVRIVWALLAYGREFEAGYSRAEVNS